MDVFAAAAAWLLQQIRLMPALEPVQADVFGARVAVVAATAVPPAAVVAAFLAGTVRGAAQSGGRDAELASWTCDHRAGIKLALARRG
jgi:hypothetical protein